MWQMPCDHPGQIPINVSTKSYTRSTYTVPSRHHRTGTYELIQRLMGIDWMNRVEMGLSIPPAYTEWIGAQLIRTLTPSQRTTVGS
jgi:hypothetical protein